jgi:large conductance mechanosensitive channel
MGKEFKDFIARGNVVDLAVAVVVGAAFGSIVSSFVRDILMPIVGAIFGGVNFSGLSLNIGNASIGYGNFIQSIINFLVIALCIFLVVLFMNKFILKRKMEKAEATTEAELLTEIRDLLKEKKK